MKNSLRFVYACSVALLLIAPVAQADGGWSERIALDGDFRLRFESIDVSDTPDRERSRLRARLGLEALVNDDITFYLRFATGDGSPVSTNVTLDSGFSAKDIQLDRAYVDWQASDTWTVRAGKMKSPWYRAGGTQLVWDSDLNPEGIAGLYKSGAFFGSVALFAVEERASADDSLLTTLQGGWTTELADDNELAVGLGYFSYSNAQGNAAFYNGNANGNSLDGLGNYLNDYRLIEAFVEFKTSVRDLPLTLYVDAVQNTEAGDQDTGFAIGANLGAIKGPGTARVGYAWQDTEADAVVGTFSDSDFADGRSDSSGHVIRATYALRDNVALGGSLIVAERGEFAGNEQDFNRIMLDIQFSFD